MIRNLSIADYHASDCISHSKLEVFRRNAALYKLRYIDKTLAFESSDAMDIGSALHARALEGVTAYNARFVELPADHNGRTKEGKAAIEFAAKNGFTALTQDEAKRVRTACEKLVCHKSARQLLVKGEAEVTFRHKLGALPVQAQCRIDWLNLDGCELTEGRPYVVDLKKHDDIKAFPRVCFDRGYHRQAGFYQQLLADCGLEVRDFFFIAAQTEEPFGVTVWRCTDGLLAKGADETIQDLVALSRCYKANNWPASPDDVQALELPSWAKGD